jgi:Protein of unknown function (DUF3108)
MPFAVRFTLPPIGALLLLVGGALARPESQSERILMRFEGFGPAGIHVLTSRTKIDQTGDRYAITSDLATRGLASIVVSLTGHAEVRGQITAGTPYPEMYREVRRRNDDERHNRVDYPPDGAVVGASNPPPPEPVTAAAARGTIDNLTAYFLVERQLGRLGHCARAIRVFDGRHRFDLYFANVGHKELSPEGGQQFSGRTTVCRMTRVEIAGFASESGEGVQSGTIWYAQLLPGDLMVPVRMRLVSELGEIDVYLAELQGRGVDRKLME